MWSEVFLLFSGVLLFGGIFSACAYGWLPFLIDGVARWRRGEGGKWQLAVAGVWVALLGAFILWSFSPMSSPYMRNLYLSFLLSAWIPLFIWGIARIRRKKKGGAWMTAVGGVWCLLAVSVIGYWSVKVFHVNARFSKVFNPGTYTGALATVEFPYTGEGYIRLTMFPMPPPYSAWFVDVADTNRMVIPAGEYQGANLRVRLERRVFDFRFDTPFIVAQDEVFTFSGGFPFVASVDVKKMGDDRLSLYLILTDSAGNRVSYWSIRGKISFEALSPDGEQFLRGDFEYSHRGLLLPTNAPPSFIIRPVLPAMPFEVEIRDTEVSR